MKKGKYWIHKVFCVMKGKNYNEFVTVLCYEKDSIIIIKGA